MSQVYQSALDATEAPRGVLFRHAHDQLLDLLRDAGSATLTTWRAPVKLLGDQLRIPAQEGLGRHEGCHLCEALAAEGVGTRREATAFRVRHVYLAATEMAVVYTLSLH